MFIDNQNQLIAGSSRSEPHDLHSALNGARALVYKHCLPPGFPFVWILLVLLALFSWASFVAVAKEAQSTEDPAIEQRMKTLTQQLRCLVCQSETLADSQSEWAQTVRSEIREQLKAGKSDQEVMAFLTARYGDFVLYKPPVKPRTYLLWFFPFVLLIGGTAVLFLYVKSRSRMIKETPLTAAERKRAEEILRNA